MSKILHSNAISYMLDVKKHGWKEAAKHGFYSHASFIAGAAMMLLPTSGAGVASTLGYSGLEFMNMGYTAASTLTGTGVMAAGLGGMAANGQLLLDEDKGKKRKFKTQSLNQRPVIPHWWIRDPNDPRYRVLDSSYNGSTPTHQGTSITPHTAIPTHDNDVIVIDDNGQYARRVKKLNPGKSIVIRHVSRPADPNLPNLIEKGNMFIDTVGANPGEHPIIFRENFADDNGSRGEPINEGQNTGLTLANQGDFSNHYSRSRFIIDNALEMANYDRLTHDGINPDLTKFVSGHPELFDIHTLKGNVSSDSVIPRYDILRKAIAKLSIPTRNAIMDSHLYNEIAGKLMSGIEPFTDLEQESNYASWALDQRTAAVLAVILSNATGNQTIKQHDPALSEVYKLILGDKFNNLDPNKYKQGKMVLNGSTGGIFANSLKPYDYTAKELDENSPQAVYKNVIRTMSSSDQLKQILYETSKKPQTSINPYKIAYGAAYNTASFATKAAINNADLMFHLNQKLAVKGPTTIVTTPLVTNVAAKGGLIVK